MMFIDDDCSLKGNFLNYHQSLFFLTQIHRSVTECISIYIISNLD